VDKMSTKPKSTPKTALILVDRDGVLCKNDVEGITSVSKFKLVPGIVESFRQLDKSNFRISVVTNQSYIALGRLSVSELDVMNHMLTEKVAEAGIGKDRFIIKVCPHGKDGSCDCRKPKIGLIEQSVSNFGLDPKNTRFYMVEDKSASLKTLTNYYDAVLKPLGVSRSSITTILINWEYGEQREKYKDESLVSDYEVKSLLEAFTLIRKNEDNAR